MNLERMSMKKKLIGKPENVLHGPQSKKLNKRLEILE